MQLAVGMISVALLSLLLTFALQFVNLVRADLQPPDIEGIVERLIAENPADESLEAIREFPHRLRRALLSTTLLSVALSGGLWVYLAIRFARRIARPIERVTDAASRITSGDLSARVALPPDTVGETARLLEHFNEMAAATEAYERERTEMIAAIAHELRTPLAVMLARLELMEEGLVEPSAGEVKRLRHQAELLARLVGDLRTLSLADADRLSLHKQRVELGDLVRRVADGFRERALVAGVSLEVALGPVGVVGDPDRLEQVLNNLLDNALKYTPRGGKVTVALEANGDRVRLSVSDTGPGLGAEPERLFGRFYRADDDPGGSGLGLALVKVLVELHGGSVAARDLPGGGACFEVWLAATAEPGVGG